MGIKIEPDEFFTNIETGELLNLSRKTLDRNRTLGIGPAFMKVGGKIYYKGESLIRWLEAGSFKSTSEAKASRRARDAKPNKSVAPISKTKSSLRKLTASGGGTPSTAAE